MSQTGNPKSVSPALEIVWIGNDRNLAEMVDYLADQQEIAVDTEFHREKTYFPRLALVQFGVPGKAFLVDPFAVHCSKLAPLMSSGAELVFHALEQDLDILERATGERAKRVFDTQLAASFIGLSRPSLAHLADRILSVELPKADRLSDWTQRPLSDAQKRYAASDVAHLLDLKRVISDQLAAADRLDWVYEELDISASKRKGPTDPEFAWLKIKECRGLRGTTRKVAKSVAEWREERAMEQDVPPRYILGDLTVAAIAQLVPNTKADLLKVRGLDSRQLANGLDAELLEAVKQGIEMDKVPEYPQGQEESIRGNGAVVSLCISWLAQRCSDEKLDPQIVGTRDDVACLIAGEKDARLGHGWRFDMVGKELLKVAAGELCLTGGRGGTVVAIPVQPEDLVT